MAEMVVVKCDIGSKAATVLCPDCARISRQILKAAFNNGSNNELLTAHTCPVCGTVYHACNSFGADVWKAAYSRYLLNSDAYNTEVKGNYSRRQQAVKESVRQQSSPASDPLKQGVPVREETPGEDIERQSAMQSLAANINRLREQREQEEEDNNGSTDASRGNVQEDATASEPVRGNRDHHDDDDDDDRIKIRTEPVESSTSEGSATPAATPEEGAIPPKTMMERKIDRWKRELLDTGKRNKMINYRETKRATLKILEPGPTELFNQLAVSEKTLTFQRPISKDSDFRTYSMLALLETLSYSLPVHVGDIKAEGTVMEREKTLKNLRSKTKLAQEEQGTNILYLSFGFILWREHNRDSSPWLRSPLLMMPVQLGLKSLNAPYTLSKYDDEIEVNPTLDYLFNQNYGIDLPTFELKNKDSFENYLEQIEEIIDKKGWKLVREVSLGLLSFLKISMYHDLNNNREQMMNNPVIQAISGDRHALEELPAQARNFNFDKTQPTEWHEVVDSDSSQEEAILLSKLGVSFVMQGPPGTGKSQTITNIIAEALGDGKKVLFVSEKSAALQVVLKRLTEAHLDDFCLSLHNYKANKKEIIDNIGANLGLSRGYIDNSVMGELTELFHDRQYLDEYAEELHRKIEPFGESVYMVFGKLARLSDATAIEFKLQNPTGISKEEFSSLLYLVDAFEKALNAMDGSLTENPWANTTANSSGQVFKTEMMNATDGLDHNLGELEGLVVSLNQNFACQLDPNWIGLSGQLDQYEAVFGLPLFPVDWRSRERRSLLKNRAVREEEKRSSELKHAESVKTLSEKIRAEWIALAITLSRDNLSLIINRKGYQESAEEGQSASEYNTEVISFLDWTLESTEEITENYQEAARLLGLSEGDSLSDVITVARILKTMQDAPAMDSDWFDVQKTASYIEQAEQAKHHQTAYVQKRAGILENWEKSVLDLDAGEMLARFKTRYTTDFYRKKESIDRDLDQLRVLYKSIGVYIEDTEIIGMLQSLVDLNAERKWFADNDARIRATIPMLYEGEETDWDHVLSSVRVLADEAAAHQTKLKQLTEQVLSAWEPGILMIDSVAMLNRFKTEHIGFFHKMKAAYKEDIKQMRLLSKSVGAQIEDTAIVAVLQLLGEIKTEQQWFLENAERFSTQLPTHYHGEDTDWGMVDREITRIADEARKHQTFLNEKKDRILEKWDSAVLETDPTEILRRFREEYTENYRITNDLYKQDIHYLMGYSKHIGEKLTGAAAVELLSAVKDVSTEKAWYQDNDARLRENFKRNYVGLDTDWDKVIRGIHVAADVATQIPGSAIPEETIRSILAVLEDSEKESDVQRLSNALEEDRILECAGDVQKALAAPELPLKLSLKSVVLPGLHNVKAQEERISSLITVLDEARRDGASHYQNIKELADTIDAMLNEMNWFIGNTLQFEETSEELSKRTIAQQMEFASVISERYAGETEYIPSEDLEALFRDKYAGFKTDWQQIQQDIDAVSAFETRGVPDEVAAFIGIVSDDESKRDTAASQIKRIRELLETSERGFTYFDGLFPTLDMKNISFHDVVAKYLACLNGFGELNKWLDFVETRKECDAKGLIDFTEKIVKRNNSVKDVRKAFERGFYMQWLSLAIDDVPSVQTFRRRVHEQRLGKFKKLDEKQFDISKARIRESIIRTFPSRNSMTSARSELGILRHEMEKKRRIMPLRKLFHEIPTLLLTLKPCLMMSPLSVAYFLNAEDYHFDMVIFDEASQIFPQDAVGAIFRADQVIIAGDTKQLPPTNFFSASTSNSSDDYDDDNEEDYEEEVYDSILEETANVLPNRTLLWHYRSKHEHLIAFSNQEIYRNELVTFPSSNESEPDTGVEFSFVEGGYYDRGGKRNNILEAKRCVELVREHIEKHPERSLGIIALSEAQQQTILNEIQKFREENPKYEFFFAEDKEEEFFVKNLENVQGDERDTIFLSICYAKTKAQIAGNKPMAMNFGPVMKAGGERRLNVAVTRAKINVKLVASILPSDIDLNRTESEGIRMIRSYIEFAMNGGATLASANQSTMPDDFVNAVYRFLSEKGYKLRQYVGCSGYKIDIAVEHPELPDEFVAGIECDGLSYASARTARDRDRLRGAVLKNMGWNLYRVWSTEWYHNPEIEGQKLLEFISQAIAKTDERLKALKAQKEAEERKRQEEAERERLAREKEEKRRQLEEQRLAEAERIKAEQAAEKRRKAAEQRREEERKRQEEARLKEQRELAERKRQEELRKQQEQRAALQQAGWIKVGATVAHTAFGIGTIRELDSKYIAVKFPSGDKRFAMPDAFTKGYLKKAEGSAPAQPVTKSPTAGSTVTSGGTAKSGLYAALVGAGFSCIDNRASSHIIWVLYQADKAARFEQIAAKYHAQYKLEKRGAMATNGRAAWRIMS